MSDSAPGKLLVVEDNASLAENPVEILAEAGYSAAAAGDCRRARELAAAGLDVALVDLRLPDGDGISLARELRELSGDSQVVLLTGFASVESAAAAVRAGACAYLVKPCATPDLLLTVDQAMRQVRMHRERQELRIRTAAAERLATIGTLTAGLSHEIRNPLNAAGLQLSILERRVRRLPAGADQTALLGPLSLVRDEIDRLEHILQDFLQFARPREPLTRPVPVATLVEKVLDLLEADAERRSIRIERSLRAQKPIAGDEEQLRQALMNLAINAIEASPPGRSVRVASSDEAARVRIDVDDSGPGVPAELRHRIFEPFFTTKASGSGLGLPIVHAIVTQHGGEIVVAEAPGGGARFSLVLPTA